MDIYEIGGSSYFEILQTTCGIEDLMYPSLPSVLLFNRIFVMICLVRLYMDSCG